MQCAARVLSHCYGREHLFLRCVARHRDLPGSSVLQIPHLAFACFAQVGRGTTGEDSIRGSGRYLSSLPAMGKGFYRIEQFDSARKHAGFLGSKIQKTRRRVCLHLTLTEVVIPHAPLLSQIACCTPVHFSNGKEYLRGYMSLACFYAPNIGSVRYLPAATALLAQSVLLFEGTWGLV